MPSSSWSSWIRIDGRNRITVPPPGRTRTPRSCIALITGVDGFFTGKGEWGTAAKPGLDLVTYKKDAARVAALADAPEVAVGGHPDAALPLDRLDDHGRDRVVQHLVEGVEVIEGDVPDAFEHGCERVAILRVGRRRQGAEGAPVVGAMRGNDADTPGRDARELERRLDRLGSRVCKRDP